VRAVLPVASSLRAKLVNFHVPTIEDARSSLAEDLGDVIREEDLDSIIRKKAKATADIKTRFILSSRNSLRAYPCAILSGASELHFRNDASENSFANSDLPMLTAICRRHSRHRDPIATVHRFRRALPRRERAQRCVWNTHAGHLLISVPHDWIVTNPPREVPRLCRGGSKS
jgi:hypothetical protein